MDEALLLLRLLVGVLIALHGTQKLFGWWGGEGLDGAADFFGRQGYRPPRLMAGVAGLTETGAGLLLALGLLTPLACLMLIGTLVNVVALHLPNGWAQRNNGFEYELVLLGVAVAVLFAGPGHWSLDALVDLPALPTGGRLGLLVLGGASGVAVFSSRRPGPTTVAHTGDAS